MVVPRTKGDSGHSFSGDLPLYRCQVQPAPLPGGPQLLPAAQDEDEGVIQDVDLEGVNRAAVGSVDLHGGPVVRTVTRWCHGVGRAGGARIVGPCVCGAIHQDGATRWLGCDLEPECTQGKRRV